MIRLFTRRRPLSTCGASFNRPKNRPKTAQKPKFNTSIKSPEQQNLLEKQLSDPNRSKWIAQIKRYDDEGNKIDYKIKKNENLSELDLVMENLRGKKEKQLSQVEKIDALGHSRVMKNFASHRPDKPHEILKNHFFGTALKGEGKIDIYNEKKATAPSNYEKFQSLPVTQQLSLAISQYYWKYAVHEYDFTIKRGDGSRILSIVWVGHAKDVLLDLDVRSSGEEEKDKNILGWHHKGYKQQVSWKTSTHKVRAVCAIAVFLFLLFLVQVPKVIFYHFIGAPFEAVWPTRRNFWQVERNTALGFQTNAREMEKIDLETKEI